MLSTDEITNGRIFVLRLRDSDGKQTQWVETLRGETAKRWYDIYQRSDWPMLRAEAAEVFRHSVTVEKAHETCARNRCVVIEPRIVNSDELTAAQGVH